MADPTSTKTKPVTAADDFTLDLVTAEAVTPVAGITIELPQTTTLGDAHSLGVLSLTGSGEQHANDGADRLIRLRLRGADDPATKHLASPIDAATVTLLELPTRDGERLTARVKLHFVDGRTLDVTLSGAVTTPPQYCTPA